MTTIYQPLVAHFFRIMEESGLSGEQLMKKAGRTPSSLSAWRSGLAFPSFPAFIECLDVMGYELKIVKKGDSG